MAKYIILNHYCGIQSYHELNIMKMKRIGLGTVQDEHGLPCKRVIYEIIEGREIRQFYLDRHEHKCVISITCRLN